MKKSLRLAIATGLIMAGLSLGAPANANDCSDQKLIKQCGGCTINPNFSTEDPRPIVCYV